MDTNKTYQKEDLSAILEYANQEGLVALIYHERQNGERYHMPTKNMLTRRLKASDIAWIQLHQDVTGKNDKTLVHTFIIE